MLRVDRTAGRTARRHSASGPRAARLSAIALSTRASRCSQAPDLRNALLAAKAAGFDQQLGFHRAIGPWEGA